MKTNAPERIWIDPTNDLPKLCGHIDKDSVEYIRKDAFIEKARVWLTITAYKNGEFCYNPRTLVDNFCKAMKRDFAKSLFDK